MRKPEGRILSIIGTDTEIGKTIIAASLARAFAKMGLRVAAFKPFACDPACRADGTPFATDADLLARAAEMPGGSDAATGELFRAPLSPLAAARLEKREVDCSSALRKARRLAKNHDITIVEGCGGWEVPLTDRLTTADFFARLGAPTVIVARAGLGTINHTLLTLHAVRQRKLRTLGVILNRCAPGKPSPAERANPEIIAQFARVPVWGPIPHKPKAMRASGDLVKIADLPDLAEIAGKLLPR